MEGTRLWHSPHDFFDATHIYGSTLFVDFYEWLKFLGKLSETTDYDWYIKNRPNFNGKFKIYHVCDYEPLLINYEFES